MIADKSHPNHALSDAELAHFHHVPDRLYKLSRGVRMQLPCDQTTANKGWNFHLSLLDGLINVNSHNIIVYTYSDFHIV